MAKVLTDLELIDIVRRAPDEFDDSDNYRLFLDGLADLVCEHFGGSHGAPSRYADDELGWTVAITNDGYIPENGGVYAKYDEEGSLDD